MKKSKNLSRIAENPLTCYAVPFIFLGGWLLLMIINKSFSGASGYYLIHYLYHYGHGFVARGLIGEIISLFCDTVTDDITKRVIIIGAAMLMTAASLCIGKALKKARGDSEVFKWTLGFIIFLCIIPVTFRLYYNDFKLDKFVWAITLFAVFLSDTRFGIYLAPAFCVLAILVNPVFVFTGMILIAIILLQRFYDSHYSFKNGFICALSYICIIAVGLYAPISEKHLGFENATEMLTYYYSRYAGGLPESIDKFANEWIFDYFEPFGDLLRISYETYFKAWGEGIMVIMSTLFFAIPAYTVLCAVWIKAIKKEENKFQKFIFILCMISPVITIPAVIISWESSKYFANNMVAQICLLIYYCIHRNESVLYSLRSAENWCKNHLIVSSLMILYVGLFIR